MRALLRFSSSFGERRDCLACGVQAEAATAAAISDEGLWHLLRRWSTGGPLRLEGRNVGLADGL